MKVGCRVTVPFGAKKTYTALVEKVHDSTPPGDFQIKEIQALLDDEPVVTKGQFDFWKWIAQYYMCSVGEVFKAALAKKIRDYGIRETKSAAGLEFEEGNRGKELNRFQKTAMREIEESFETKDVTLFHGVTSSGKTEIYIHLINKYARAGKQVLYLLPEIALTTQITTRLKEVFGDQMGVFHSRFTDKERAEVYARQLSDNPYRLILGVRSSVFLPFRNLGLVIVDEEHETSYKQQEPAPRYHARNSAIMLAKMSGAKTLLGTATPSIESYRLAQEGKYGYVALTHRYHDLQLPDIEIVDIRRLYKQKRMKGAFSGVLTESIREALDNREQVILFQNRRGFSAFMQCRNCGWVPHCEHCDVSLTYHKSRQLQCHYCGKQYRVPECCPQCGEKDFAYVGLGTEKIEAEILRLFPDARVARMDIDTTHSRTAYEEIINGFSNHEYDILVGTQMVSKGLDFDNVSVVGILDSDSMLNLPDFRSYERSFHIMTQVAGRAGRKYHTGKVILQSRSADSPILSCVVNNDYESMYSLQIAERKLFVYPPFCRLIYVYLKHRDPARVEQCAQFMAENLRRIFGDKVLGPDRPPIARVNSLSLRKIIVKLKNNDSPTKVRQALNNVKNGLMEQSFANGLTVYYDVDPM